MGEQPTCEVSSSIGADKGSPRDSVEVVVLSRVGGAAEHVKHA